MSENTRVSRIRNLGKLGYETTSSTLYPILHDLQKSGYLVSTESVVKGKRRKNYRITPKGSRLMNTARERLRELFSEVIEHHDKLEESRRKAPS